MRISGEKVQVLMAQHCLNIEQLHRISGVAKSTIRAILHNQQQNCRLDTIGLIAKALRVDPRAIMITETNERKYIL